MNSLNDQEKVITDVEESSTQQIENTAEIAMETSNQDLEINSEPAQKTENISQEAVENSVPETQKRSTKTPRKSKKNDEKTDFLPVREELLEEVEENSTQQVENTADPAQQTEDASQEAIENSVPDTQEYSAHSTKTPRKHKNNDEKIYVSHTREELVEDLRELLLEPAVENIRTKVEAIKQAFYKQRQQPQPAEDEEVPTTPMERILDSIEIEFKELLGKYRELKAVANARIEEQKVKNLALKQAILGKLENLTSSPEDLSATIPAFRKLQAEWKKIEQVPQNMVTEIWKQYNSYQEKFYDLIKINNDLREYDFKKNLELKINLCEAVEKLESETNAVSTFQILQKLHDEWREIGPVAREERENIWNRFKEASAKINKKHQAYFDELKREEENNLKLKIALCEKMESIDLTNLKSHRQWDEKMNEVVELQNEWKNIGFAAKKANTRAYRRFRTACDAFFREKSDFFKNTKDEMQKKIDRKKEIVEQAETLKESTDWKIAFEKFTDMQREWKEIGVIPKKIADELWAKFSNACTYFFTQREQNKLARKQQAKATKPKEIENLKLKQDIIEKIKTYVPKGYTSTDIPALKALEEAFYKIGFVPIKEKPALMELFNTELDKKFAEIRKSDKSGGKQQHPAKDNTFIIKTLKKELATYINNIEFLNSTSNKGNKLIEDLNKKIENLKSKIEKIEKK